MTRPLGPALAVACALALVGGPAAGARSTTTTPGVVYTIRVVLADRAIKVGRDRFTLDGRPEYPRGAVIHYEISNDGKRPYAFRIWDQTVAPIAPGKHASILINWNYRGSFPYFTLFHHKPAGPRGDVVVF
jgi:hypothetical protein